MTFHVFSDVEQRSPEWYDHRRGILTASAVGDLITPSTRKLASNHHTRALTLTLAAERITGWTEETGVSPDMWRGIEQEPFARAAYEEHHAPATECGFIRRDEDGWSLGCSPDGLVGDDGLLEIKCPRPKAHLRTILDDAVPTEYVPQCQAALLVSGRAWVDFVSYVGGMPLFVKRVTPDPEWHATITAACQAFELDVRQIVTDYTARTAGLPLTERFDLDLKVV
jgi:putative phage-type endonuclease